MVREVSIQARDALATLLNIGLDSRFKFLNLSRQISDLLSGHRELLLELLPLVLIPLQLALDDLHVLAQHLFVGGQRVVHRCQSVVILLVIVDLQLVFPIFRGQLEVQDPTFFLAIFKLLGQLLNQGVLDLHIFLDDLLFPVKLVPLHLEVGFELRIHFDLFLLQTATLRLEFLRLFGGLRGKVVELGLETFDLICKGLRLLLVRLSLGFSSL